MGNIKSCFKSNEENLLGNQNLYKNQCPHCKFCLKSEKDKKLHIKNCVYNVKGDDRELSIYSDPYKYGYIYILLY